MGEQRESKEMKYDKIRQRNRTVIKLLRWLRTMKLKLFVKISVKAMEKTGASNLAQAKLQASISTL